MKILDELCEHLSGINIDWHICGGFAIDIYLDNITRRHKDLDITVSFKDLRKCVNYLKAKGWEIDAPVGKQRLVPIEYALENEELEFNNIWCYKKDANFIKTEKVDGIYKYLKFIDREQKELNFLEVLFNKIENNTFYYRRNHSISMSTDRAFIKKSGISILAPEIVLLYKSTNHVVIITMILM